MEIPTPDWSNWGWGYFNLRQTTINLQHVYQILYMKPRQVMCCKTYKIAAVRQKNEKGEIHLIENHLASQRSDYRALGLTGPWPIGPSDYRTLGITGPRNTGLSRAVGSCNTYS